MRASLVCCLAVGFFGLFNWITAAPPAAEPTATGEQLKPQWRVGQQWVIETISRPIQFGGDIQDAPPTSKPIPWQFAVVKEEKLANHDCFRVDIKCLLPGPAQPMTTIWVDKKSLTLRQIQTQLPVQGELRTVTESYHFSDGQAAPVLGPLTALPIDLPLFLPGKPKAGKTEFVYEAISGPGGKKALGDISFSIAVEQEISSAKPEHVKGLLNEGFSKDLDTRPVMEVQLKTPDRKVRQLWRPELPWPAYSDNGSTVSRLIKVVPAPTSSNK